jgi:hypothetical protein
MILFSVDQKICERWRLTISELLCEFPQISRTILSKNNHCYARLSQVLRKMGSKNAHGCIQNAVNDFGVDFLERYHKDGDEFLNHIIWITGDETWV